MICPLRRLGKKLTNTLKDRTMDGQRRNAENRSVYLDQPRGVARARFGDDNSTRNGKIAIKPGVPYATPVGLNADLEIVTGGTLRNGSDLRMRLMRLLPDSQTREDVLGG
jgi:hypothetical protein